MISDCLILDFLDCRDLDRLILDFLDCRDLDRLGFMYSLS